MPTYYYKAFNDQGKIIKGFYNADSERGVRKLISDQGLSCFKIKKTYKKTNNNLNVNSKKVLLFTKQLSNLLKSNVGIDDAIKLAVTHITDVSFKKVIYEISENVQQGQRLADAMAPFNRIFSKTFVSLVKIGDESGNLGFVFTNLSYYLEERLKIKQKIISALVYPAILFGFSMFIILVLLNVVMPVVVSQFTNSNVELPFLTRQLLFLANHFSLIIMGLISFCIIVFVIYKSLIKNKQIHLYLHSLMLRIPILGSFICVTEIENFSSSLYLMVHSGIPLNICLKESSHIFYTIYFQKVVYDLAIELDKGNDFSQLISGKKYFPETFIQLITSGYQAGNLAESLKNASDYMKSDLESRRQIILSLIEPVIIVIMGILTLIIVLAILLPILKMNALILN